MNRARHHTAGFASAFALIASCAGPGTAPQEEDVVHVLEIALAGNERFDDDRLRAIVVGELFETDAVRPSKASVDDAAFALELFYLARGFPEARVEYEYTDVPDRPVRASFAIAEGPLVRVAELTFVGAEELEGETLAGFFGDMGDGGVFVEAEVDASARALRDHYFDLGFRRAVVESEVRFDDPGEEEQRKRTAAVEVRVQEGVRFRIQAIELSGGLDSLAPHGDELAERYVGQTYTPRLAYEIRSLVLSAYASRGYADCAVTAKTEVDEETGDVRVILRITPGAEVIVRGLRVEGNERTRVRVIRDRIPLQRGDRYDAEAVRVGIRELYATGLFESVRVELDGEGGAQRDLIVHVVESPSREVRIEPGYGSYEGPRVAVAFEDRNAFGTARRASLTAHVSELAQGARLAVSNTRFLGYPLTLSVSLFTEEREEPSFEVNRVGTDIVLRRRFGERTTTSFGYEYRVNKLVDIDGIITSAEQVEEPNVGALTTSLIFDNRDNLLLPTTGTRARVQLEWADAALGSELDALSLNVGLAHLFSLRDGTGLAVTARTGIVSPIGDTEILPIQEREFNGGENSVRSFKKDELGPKDSLGEPIGGEASSFVSLELRQRIAGNFSCALFADAGNVQPSIDDYFAFDGFRYGVGVGLRYALPIGPVRLDLGVNPNARDGEDDYVLHFSVGFPY